MFHVSTLLPHDQGDTQYVRDTHAYYTTVNIVVASIWLGATTVCYCVQLSFIEAPF